MAAALALGAVIGVLLGLLGGGGSILAVPALVYGAGLPLAEAIPTSLLVVALSAGTGVVPRLRKGQVQWRIALVFGAAGAASAAGGAAVNRLLDPRLVLLGFAALMAAAGVRMLREQPEAGGDCALPGGGINWRGCLPKAIGSGLAVGFLTGLFGVGGGFLVIPALVLLLGLTMSVAVGTSLVVIVITSSAAFAAHAGGVPLDYGVAAAFAGSAVAGSLAAGRWGARLSADRLRRPFGWLVLALAVLIAAQLAVAPGLVTAAS